MKPLVLMKFGGTSLRDGESRGAALAQVRRTIERGRDVAIVVSAMGRKGEPYATDTLIALLDEAGSPVEPRELDLMMSAGEVISATFFAQMLTAGGLPARAFTGPQAGVLTDDQAGQARILDVKPARLRAALAEGFIPVVAGFQGLDEGGEIRTLGRGGSDTSAVALGAALDAEIVEIYSDVDGIACADPRRIPEAPFLEDIGAEQILIMAEEGSRVLHPRAVAASLPSKTPLRARNTFSDAPGTLVHHMDDDRQARPVAIAHREKQVLLLFNAAEDPRRVVPELLDIGRGRHLLLADIYLSRRLASLRKEFGDFAMEEDWATASVILSAESDEDTPDGPEGSETLPSPDAVWRYLVREKNLDQVLRALFEIHFN